jgi:hypothetical protein
MGDLDRDTALAGEDGRYTAVLSRDWDIAEGMAWFVDADLAGLEHDVTQMPSVPPPETVPTMAERNAEAGMGNPFRFWDNLENRMLDWRSEWPPPGPLPPTSDSWFRFLPTATFDDPLVDAARLVVVLDTMTLRPAPQVGLRHPSCNVGAAFPGGPQLRSSDPRAPTLRRRQPEQRTRPRPDRRSRTCGAGRIEHGRLLASGASQLLSTPVPPA